MKGQEIKTSGSGRSRGLSMAGDACQEFATGKNRRRMGAGGRHSDFPAHSHTPHGKVGLHKILGEKQFSSNGVQFRAPAPT